MDVRDFIAKARRAQQENEQRHDVQLEIPGYDSNVVSITALRQAQIEYETGRDPRD